MGIGCLIGGAGGALIALVIAAATSLFAYWNSDRMVLSMYGAQEVDQRRRPRPSFIIVAELAGRASLPMPTRVRDGRARSPTRSPPAAIRRARRSP